MSIVFLWQGEDSLFADLPLYHLALEDFCMCKVTFWEQNSELRLFHTVQKMKKVIREKKSLVYYKEYVSSILIPKTAKWLLHF